MKISYLKHGVIYYLKVAFFSIWKNNRWPLCWWKYLSLFILFLIEKMTTGHCSQVVVPVPFWWRKGLPFQVERLHNCTPQFTFWLYYRPATRPFRPIRYTKGKYFWQAHASEYELKVCEKQEEIKPSDIQTFHIQKGECCLKKKPSNYRCKHRGSPNS